MNVVLSIMLLGAVSLWGAGPVIAAEGPRGSTAAPSLSFVDKALADLSSGDQARQY